MENTNTRSEKLFIGLGVITIISGILLIVEKNYVVGVSGSIVGIGLVVQNMKQIKDKTSE